MTNQNILEVHMRSIHKGIKYPCGQCRHQAISKGNLAEHIRAVHKGIKYPCVQCQHQATTKGRLVQRRRSAYERMSKF